MLYYTFGKWYAKVMIFHKRRKEKEKKSKNLCHQQ